MMTFRSRIATHPNDEPPRDWYDEDEMEDPDAEEIDPETEMNQDDENWI